MTEQPSHLWSCGCVRNKAGAHQRRCPEFRTIEEYAGGKFVRRWVRRKP